LDAGVDERARVLDLVRRHGWNTTAFQTLEAGYSYFFDRDACVAYVDTGGAWVAAGAPIAAADELAAVTARFLNAARAAGKRACYFATEERLVAAAGISLRSLRIGEQPIWDPREWADVLKSRKSLREQLRRARAKGVEVRSVRPEELTDGATRAAMARLADRWLATRRLAPMGFLVQVEPFSFPDLRRSFAAEIEGRLVGFAGVVPVPARGGWFLEDLLRDPMAPNGTAELLVDAVMRWAAASGSAWVTLGLAPLAGEVSGLLRLARKSSTALYDFHGLRAYKAKLRPSWWMPVYLSFPTTQGAIVSLVDALAAFTSGGFVRFGLRSLSRAPRTTLILRTLTTLLMPWTLWRTRRDTS
jgi:phosphatidylglycerol lysyltransferase